jgi:lysylphosphatidylglycerol synthetase-like protein (DUF2156 family)
MAYDTGSRPISATVLASKAPHELLIILGGALAILLSAVSFALKYMESPTLLEWNPILRTFLITLVLGGALIIAGVITRKNVTNGAIVAVVVCIVMIVYGGQEGQIGGFVGLIGAAIAAVSPYLPRHK